MRAVIGHGLQKTRQKRAAHLGLLGDERVHEHHGQAAAFGAHLRLLEVAGGGEGIRRGLVQATGTHDGADAAKESLVVRKPTDVVLRSGNRRLDAAHAPQAQHFLDEVNLALEIGAERGRYHTEDGLAVGRCALNGAAQTHKRALHELRLDRRAADKLHTALAKRKLFALNGRRVHVDRTGNHGRAAALLEERRRDGRDLVAARAVDLALVADGRLGDEREVAARARDMTRVEASRPQSQHVVRGAHRSRNRSCPSHRRGTPDARRHR